MPTQSRARRVQSRGGREVIVAAAVQTFAELGYHGTSVRDIARVADVTVASIYHHFVSKQAILVDIMERTLGDVLALTHAAVDAAGTTATERLGALMEAWVLFHTSRQPEALIGASELRSLESEGRLRVVALRDEQEALFCAVVEQGVRDGEFATTHSAEAVRAVITMGYSVASWYRPSGRTSPQQMARRYRDLALGVVGAG